MTGSCLVCVSDLHSADAAAALLIAALLCSTMYPLCVYSGKILLQVGLSVLYLCRVVLITSCLVCKTVPEHVVGQLSKCLSEVILPVCLSLGLSVCFHHLSHGVSVCLMFCLPVASLLCGLCLSHDLSESDHLSRGLAVCPMVSLVVSFCH